MSNFFRAAGHSARTYARSSARRSANSHCGSGFSGNGRFFHKSSTAGTSMPGFSGAKTTKSAFSAFKNCNGCGASTTGSGAHSFGFFANDGVNFNGARNFSAAGASASTQPANVQTEVSNNSLASSGTPGAGGSASLIADVGDDDDSNMHIKVFRCLLRNTLSEVETAVEKAVRANIDGVPSEDKDWRKIQFCTQDLLPTKFRIVNESCMDLKRKINNPELNYIQSVQDLIDVLYTVPEEDPLNPYARIDRLEVMFASQKVPANVRLSL